MSGVGGGVGGGIGGTAVDPTSPGGVNIDVSEITGTPTLDEIIKGDGAGGWLIGPQNATTAALAAREPTGFVDAASDITISWVDGTKILTVAPTGATFDLWIRGKKYVKTAETKDISGVIAEGFWYFYYDSAGALQAGQTVWDLSQHAPVAYLYWDATNTKALNLGWDPHGLTMDWATHALLHQTHGALFQTGLAVAGNIAGGGGAASHAQVSVGAGTIYDEDLKVQITSGVGASLFEQDLALPAKIPVWYLDGSGPVWRKKTANTYPLLEGTARIKYNQYSAPNWLQTDISTNSNYAAVWIFATNGASEPVIAILGQREDTTLNNAKDNNTLDGLNLAGIFLQEMKIIARLIFQTSTAYGNIPKARLRDILDLRDVTNFPSGTFVATSHNSLAGRDQSPAHPSSALTVDPSGFAAALSSADDTVQKVADTLDNYPTLVGEPTGFPNLTDTTISWNDGTKVFTIAPTGASFDVWVLGKKYTKTGAQTKDISGSIAEGNWYFYYDSAGVLQGSQTPFDFMQHATVAVMHWDATNTVAITFCEERHMFYMPRMTMEFLHNAYGVVFMSGLGLTPKTTPIPGDGTADADAEIELADGTLLDEDITVNPRDSGSGHFVQDLQPIAQLPVFHRETVTGVWRKKTANNFPVQEGPGAGNDRLQWNNPNAGGGGIWGLSEVGDGEFVAVFVCACPEVNEPVFCILGQETHATQQAAQEANVYADLALGTMGFREQKVLYRIIFQSFDSYSNTPKARIVETIDLRAAQLGSPAGTIVPSVHNALSGRGDSDVHPAASIAPSTGSFNGALSAADDTVQKALDTLDDAGIFGSNYTKGVSEALSTTLTSLPSWIDKLTVALPAITGTMLVTAYAEVSTVVKDKAVACRLYNSTDAVVLGEVLHSTMQGGTLVDYHCVKVSVEVVLTGTAKDMKIQFADDSGSTAHIRRARIFAWRVA